MRTVNPKPDTNPVPLPQPPVSEQPPAPQKNLVRLRLWTPPPKTAGSALIGSNDSDLWQFIHSIDKLTVDSEQDLPRELSNNTPAMLGDVPGTNTVVEHNVTKQFEKLATFDPNPRAVWAGSIVQGNSLSSGLLTPVLLPRSAGILVLSNAVVLGTSADPAAYAKALPAPDLASAQTAVQQLVTQNVAPDQPALFFYSAKQIFSEEHAALELGASYKSLSVDVKGKLSLFRDQTNTMFLVTFSQVYYTISFDPKGFFDLAVSKADVMNYTGPGNPLLYIASVTYGRTLHYLVSSRSVASEVKASLDATFGGLGSSGAVNANMSFKKVLQNSTTDVLVMGGSGTPAADLLIKSNSDKQIDKVAAVSAYIKAGANFSITSPGVPVSYVAAYLKDLSVAQLSVTTNYKQNTFTASPVPALRLKFNTNGDDKDVEEKVSVTVRNSSNEIIIANGDEFICAPDGSRNKKLGQLWKDHTSQDFVIPLRKPIPFTDFAGMTLELRKAPFGSADGCGWQMTLEVSGTTNDGHTFTLLPETKNRRVGDGHPYVLHFPFMNPVDPDSKPDGKAAEDNGQETHLVK